MALIDNYSREDFLNYFKQHRSNNKVAEHLGISAPSVKRIKKEFGITQEDYEYFHLGKKAWNSDTGNSSSCEICGTVFKACLSKSRRFCSRDCNHVWFSDSYKGDKFKGSRNPNFGNGEALKKAYRNGLVKKKPFSGKEYTKGKRTSYKGIVFRSSWEAVFAEELDAQNIKWQYEITQFQLSTGKHYIPDFYTPEDDKFYEVKGFWWPSAKEKFELFRKECPEIEIEVKGQDWWNERQKSKI